MGRHHLGMFIRNISLAAWLCNMEFDDARGLLILCNESSCEHPL